MIVSGGLRTAEQARSAYAESGADAVMIARGSLGNPWIFAELCADRDGPPTDAEIEAELRWVLDRAAEHWGPERAARNLRKFYPWYVEALGYEGPAADRFQRTETPRRGPRAARRAAGRARRIAAQSHRYNRAPCPSRVRKRRRDFGRFSAGRPARGAGRYEDEEEDRTWLVKR